MNTLNDESQQPAIEETKEFASSNLPVKLQKILAKLGNLKDRLHENKREATQMCMEVNALEKMVEQYVTKIAKDTQKSTTEKRKRKPSGFASPTKVSPELCIFMGRQVGELISRTETSKFLSNYISTNQLTDPQNKTIIRPDGVLSKLLGDEAQDAEITYFTIQKYMNRHFIGTTSDQSQSLEYSV
jgi:chromatin remodeling complex protein RSC6